MENQAKIEDFRIPTESELQAEHAAVKEFIEESGQLGTAYYVEVDLKLVPRGREFLDAPPEAAARIVLAAMEQARHWDGMAARLRNQGCTLREQVNAYLQPGWADVTRKSLAARSLVRELTRRKLPFSRGDLLQILQWYESADGLSLHGLPAGNMVRALQSYVQSNEVDAEFSKALQQFADRLRSACDKNVTRLAAAVEQLIPHRIEAR